MSNSRNSAASTNESIVNKWDDVNTGNGAKEVLVCLSVRCKVVAEKDQGALSLDGTAVQRIVFSGAPEERPQQWSGFGMKRKGPTGEQLATRGDVSEKLWERFTEGGHEYRLSEQKFALQNCPLENFEHSHSFPFRILQATIDLELQGSDIFRPELCVSDCPATPDQGIVRSKPSRLPAKLTRRKRPHIPLMSRRLAFVRDHPTAEIIPISSTSQPNAMHYSRMRLTFYMHEPPTRIVFKVIGPFGLVLMLMLMNFQEFYGLLDSWKGCTSDEDRDSDYLANGIGIAITAVFVFPSTNSTRAKSAYSNSTSDYDDYLTMVFLVGLTLATVPQCQVALSGCVISFSVVSLTLVSLVVHWIRCKKIKLKDSVRVREQSSTPRRPQQEVQFKLNDWKRPSSYERRRAKDRKVWGCF